MALIPAFNPADVPEPENRDFSPIPTGEYIVHMVESDLKDVKPPKTGQYVEAVFEIVEGEHKGRKLWERFNIINPNDDAVRIAYQQLAAIANAVGHQGEIRDTSALHFKRLTARVEFIAAGTTKRNGYRYEKDTNEIKAYKPAAGGVGNAPAQGTAPTAAATPASPSSPPWAQRNAA